jgi:hypothetical protein
MAPPAAAQAAPGAGGSTLPRLQRRVPGAQLPVGVNSTRQPAEAPVMGDAGDPAAARALIEEFEAGVRNAQRAGDTGPIPQVSTPGPNGSNGSGGRGPAPQDMPSQGMQHQGMQHQGMPQQHQGMPQQHQGMQQHHGISQPQQHQGQPPQGRQQHQGMPAPRRDSFGGSQGTFGGPAPGSLQTPPPSAQPTWNSPPAAGHAAPPRQVPSAAPVSPPVLPMRPAPAAPSQPEQRAQQGQRTPGGLVRRVPGATLKSFNSGRGGAAVTATPVADPDAARALIEQIEAGVSRALNRVVVDDHQHEGSPR